jgi:hypothetical protein
MKGVSKNFFLEKNSFGDNQGCHRFSSGAKPKLLEKTAKLL